MQNYDVAVLGGGPGGAAAAARAAQNGATVCLIEEKHLGGVCLNAGCMPSKALLAAGDLAWRMRTADGIGLTPAEPNVDGPTVMERIRRVVEDLRAAQEQTLARQKSLEILRGRGRLTGPKTIDVAGPDGMCRITAESIILATGSAPVRPGFLPWDSGRVWTTDEAVVAEDLPGEVLVIGGGVIGCELATAWAELGARVVLVEMLDRLLAVFDVEASRAVTASLTARGVEILTGRKVERMDAEGGGLTTTLDDGRSFVTDRALAAVGRRANVGDIGLEATGVEVSGGVVPVDPACRTNVDGVYAVGDLAEPRQYAHLAERMGHVAGENATGGEASDDRTVVPAGVYTHPEVASVGLTRTEAKERLGKVGVYRYPYSASGMARVCGETEGQLKILADGEAGHIRGALWIGPHAVDLVGELALAMRHGLTLLDLAHTIHPHPTFEEAVAGVAEAFLQRKARSRG